MKSFPGSLVLGIAGGSGSGKTTLAKLIKAAAPERVQLVSMDDYYHCNEALEPARRALVNYDHPDALDFGLIVEHLRDLKAGLTVSSPRYDFSTHSRLPETQVTAPAQVVILEGILALHHETVRSLMDSRVFVHASDDLRYERRMRRDMAERGRSLQSVELQWSGSVLPMHRQFCEPSRAHADISVDGAALGDQEARKILDALTRQIRAARAD